MGLGFARAPRAGDLARVALLVPAAFAVHQLRYLLAYGQGASLELERTGHSYLHSVVPWLVALIAVAAGCFLRAVGRALARQTTAARFTVSFLGLWTLCSVALVAIFAAQEFLEGLFAFGHPAGLAGIFGFGGWWAVPAALCLGLVLAAVFHGARWLVAEVARRRALPGSWSGPSPRALRPSLSVTARAPAPLLAGWSSRGPPA
jgi:hypothetical protein